MPARILPRLSAKHRSFGDIVRKLHLLLVHRRDRRRLAVLDDHLLRDIGITRYQVDASGLAEDGVMRRRRPDRAAALKQTHDAAAYLTFLVERADAGRRDPVRHSSEDVEAEMEAILAEHGA